MDNREPCTLLSQLVIQHSTRYHQVVVEDCCTGALESLYLFHKLHYRESNCSSLTSLVLQRKKKETTIRTRKDVSPKPVPDFWSVRTRKKASKQ